MAQEAIHSRRAIEATHLLPSIRPMLDWSNEDRIKTLHTDYCFVSYPRADEVLAKLEECFNRPKTTRPECFALDGPTSNGKTTILREFMKKHENSQLELLIGPSANGKTEILQEFKKKHPNRDLPDKTISPVAYAQVDVGAGVNLLLGKILKNYYFRWDVGSVVQKLCRVYNVMSACETKLLIIDDVQRLLDGREREESVNLIVGLSRELEIPIVLGGVEETARVLEDDTQGAAGFPIMELPQWTDGREFRELLQSWEASLPLAHASHLYENGKAKLILELSRLLDGRNPQRPGILFNIIRLLKRATEKSIRDGSESISEKHIKDAAQDYKWVQSSKTVKL